MCTSDFLQPFRVHTPCPCKIMGPSHVLLWRHEQKVCVEISVQPLLCCRMVDTPFNQAKPQSLIYKVKLIINQYMLLPGGFNDIAPVEHWGVHTLTDSNVCCGCCCWQSQGATTHSSSPLEDPASTPPSLHTEWEKQKLPLPVSDLRVEHFVEEVCFEISRRAEHSTEGQG